MNVKGCRGCRTLEEEWIFSLWAEQDMLNGPWGRGVKGLRDMNEKTTSGGRERMVVCVWQWSTSNPRPQLSKRRKPRKCSPAVKRPEKPAPNGEERPPPTCQPLPQRHTRKWIRMGETGCAPKGTPMCPNFQSIWTSVEQSVKGCNTSQEGMGSDEGPGVTNTSPPAFGARPKALGQEPEAEETNKKQLLQRSERSWCHVLGRKLMFLSDASTVPRSRLSFLPQYTQTLERKAHTEHTLKSQDTSFPNGLHGPFSSPHRGLFRHY